MLVAHLVQRHRLDELQEPVLDAGGQHPIRRQLQVEILRAHRPIHQLDDLHDQLVLSQVVAQLENRRIVLAGGRREHQHRWHHGALEQHRLLRSHARDQHARVERKLQRLEGRETDAKLVGILQQLDEAHGLLLLGARLVRHHFHQTHQFVDEQLLAIEHLLDLALGEVAGGQQPLQQLQHLDEHALHVAVGLAHRLDAGLALGAQVPVQVVGQMGVPAGAPEQKRVQGWWRLSGCGNGGGGGPGIAIKFGRRGRRRGGYRLSAGIAYGVSDHHQSGCLVQVVRVRRCVRRGGTEMLLGGGQLQGDLCVGHDCIAG